MVLHKHFCDATAGLRSFPKKSKITEKTIIKNNILLAHYYVDMVNFFTFFILSGGYCQSEGCCCCSSNFPSLLLPNCIYIILFDIVVVSFCVYVCVYLPGLLCLAEVSSLVLLCVCFCRLVLS